MLKSIPLPPETKGGEFGKACAHNEPVMQELRPFAPVRVWNGRVCSREHPAPGNEGFDGCLEYLRARARRHARALTALDIDQLHFVDVGGGTRQSLPKRALLAWPAVRCDFLLGQRHNALGGFIAACGGAAPPAALVRSVWLCVRLGALRVRFLSAGASKRRLPTKLCARVLRYVLPGGPKLWREVLGLGLGLGHTQST